MTSRRAMPAAAPAAVRRAPLVSGQKMSLGLMLLYTVWAINLFDFHFFLAIKIAPALGRLANYAFVPLLVLSVFQAGTTKTKAWAWYPPLILLLVASAGSVPALANTWMGWLGIQTLLSYYALALGAAVFVRTPKDALPLIAMVSLRFLWWAVWARAAGHVVWDPSMSNPDGFGGLMVQGVAICFWFGMASRSRRQKILMFALALYCITGVVTSLARGAFLALVVVALLVWLRSPHKGRTGAGMLVGVLVIMVAANLMVGAEGQYNRTYRSGTFWEQILSVFEEGTESGTGAHRWSLWTGAVRVWATHPVFGVGPNNFGVFAADYFRPGELEGFENTYLLWGINLHSAYFQILSEFGVVGVTAFIWLMLDFMRKNRALRRPDALARWTAMGLAEKYDLRALSLALESGLVATALVNLVYASFFEPWFIAMWVANRTLWSLTCSDAEARPGATRLTPRRVSRQRQMTA